MNNLTDKLIKLIYFLIPILTVVLYCMSESISAYYIEQISKDIKLYSNFNSAVGLLLLFPFFIGILFFINTLENSKSNTTLIEKKLSIFFADLKIKTVSNTIYCAFIVIYGSLFMYTLLEAVAFITASTQLFQTVNLLTMEPYFNNDYQLNRVIFLMSLNGILFITFLLIKPVEQNNTFLSTFILLPIILSVLCVSEVFSSLDVINSMPTEGLDLISQLRQESKLTFFIIIGITIFLSIVYLMKVFKNKNIKHIMLSMVTGYILYRLSAILMTYIFCFSPTYDYLKSNPNIITVKVFENDYTINQTIVSEMDDFKDESMVESYIGLSMHNSRGEIAYMLSDKFNGDKEKALLFVADVTLTNLRHFNEREKKVVDYITNNTVETSTAINILIPLIIYDISPLSHQERILNSILKGKYQDAIDFYMIDVLNRTTKEKKLLMPGNGKSEYRSNSMGHENTQQLVMYLIRNELATLNIEDIKDVEFREIFKQKLNQKGVDQNKVSKEQAERWFKMFNTNRLMVKDE